MGNKRVQGSKRRCKRKETQEERSCVDITDGGRKVRACGKDDDAAHMTWRFSQDRGDDCSVVIWSSETQQMVAASDVRYPMMIAGTWR